MSASDRAATNRRPKDNSARSRMWDRLAMDDPDFAVLTHGHRAGGAWTSHLDEFYASGQVDVGLELDRLDPPPDYGGLAVDWGSGTGRLTLALADRFESVIGVDISSKMIDLARQRAKERGVINVTFSTVADTEPVQAAMVFSKLVLQHMASRREICRTLDWMASLVGPGGYLIVQIPSTAVDWRARLRLASRLWRAQQFVPYLEGALRKAGLSGVTMTPVPEARVRAVLARANVQLLEVRGERVGGYQYATYVARRPAGG